MRTVTKLSTAALALLMIGTASAGAACKPGQVNNKTWKFVAADANNATKYLFSCTFKTLGDGSISPDPTGCNYIVAGVGTFAAPTNLALKSGSFKAVAGDLCSYDVTMKWGGDNFTGRASFDASKKNANGNWYSTTFFGYGGFSLMRQ